MGLVSFHKMEYGVEYEIDGVMVTAFKGNHEGNVLENSALYLMELPDGRTLFYGLDSGPYLEETLELLKTRRIDIFITEATAGVSCLHNKKVKHMGLYDVKELTDTLFESGTLTKESVVYLTHINHSTSHTEMVSAVETMDFPVQTVVAYDGLKIF